MVRNVWKPLFLTFEFLLHFILLLSLSSPVHLHEGFSHQRRERRWRIWRGLMWWWWRRRRRRTDGRCWVPPVAIPDSSFPWRHETAASSWTNEALAWFHESAQINICLDECVRVILCVNILKAYKHWLMPRSSLTNYAPAAYGVTNK